MIKIAIIGKTNVGKSTIFNKLCGRKLAVTHDAPGVTRDIKAYEVDLDGIPIILMDTAGFEEYSTANTLSNLTINKITSAIKNADLLLFVVDGRSNLTNLDTDFANILRRQNKEILLIVNKSESKITINQNELFSIGFGSPHYISAEHNIGIHDIKKKIKNIMKAFHGKEEYREDGTSVKLSSEERLAVDELIDNAPEKKKKSRKRMKPAVPLVEGFQVNLNNDSITADILLDENAQFNEVAESKKEKLILAIIGRPNVGKSTIFNKLLGFERTIISEEAGTTRDAIDYDIVFENHQVTLIDTAGIRRKAKVHEKLEELFLSQSITAIRRANVVAVIIDSQSAIEKQDVKIIQIAINEGKGILLVINKSDLIKDRKEFHEELEYLIKHELYELEGVSVVYTSAIKNKNVKRIIDKALEAQKMSSKKLTTGRLNNWLNKTIDAHIPPVGISGRRIKMKYMTQVAVRPPTFNIFSNSEVVDIPDTYIRYLKHSLKKNFNLYGVPIRFNFMRSGNPYRKSR